MVAELYQMINIELILEQSTHSWYDASTTDGSELPAMVRRNEVRSASAQDPRMTAVGIADSSNLTV